MEDLLGEIGGDKTPSKPTNCRIIAIQAAFQEIQLKIHKAGVITASRKIQIVVGHPVIWFRLSRYLCNSSFQFP
jgi:hypothetical protein